MDACDDDFLRFVRRASVMPAAQRPLRLRLAHPDGDTQDLLLPQHVSGTESLCGGLEYRILCLSLEAGMALKQFIGVPAELQFVTDRGALRCASGIITEAGAGNSDGGMASYQLVLRDALAVMEKRSNSRVFLNLNELQIVQLLLAEWQQANAVLGSAFEIEVEQLLAERELPQRAFTMQHNESDAAFLRRLLSRRGICWFFRSGHAAQTKVDYGCRRIAHTMVLFDDATRLGQNAAGAVRFHRDAATEQRDTVSSWNAVRSLQSCHVTRHSWNYARAGGADPLRSEASGGADQGDSVGVMAASLDDYLVEPPQSGASHEDRATLGRLRMQRHDYETKCFHGEGSVRDLCVGERFSLNGHPEIDTHPPQEREFVVTALHIEAQNNLPAGLAGRVDALFAANRWDHAGDGLLRRQGKQAFGAVRFCSRFTCVRSGVAIVPAYDPRTDLPRPQPQSAIVVGPQRGEVYCDSLGRVNIRFPGMRIEDHAYAAGVGATDQAGASAWVRVASSWAGSGAREEQCGTFTLPRVGSEVLVIFLGGDPDKPVIIGQMFHHQAHPPGLGGGAALPDERHLSGMKSREIRGPGANQLRFDDTPGQVSAQLASTHGRSALNLGYLAARGRDGRGAARGQGAELHSDQPVAVRGAQGVLISAAAHAGGEGAQLDRDELVGVAEVLKSVAQELARLALTHAGDEAEGGQLALLVDKLTQWDRGAGAGKGTVASSQGGTPSGPHAIVAASAPAGMMLATQENLLLGAQTNIDIVCARDVQVSGGRSLLMRAMRGVTVFAHQLGMKLIAAGGNVVIQTHDGDIELTASGRIKLSAGVGIELQAPQIKMVAQGAQADYGAGAITQQSTGSHAIKSASFAHVGPAGGAPPGLTFPSTRIETDQRVLLFDPHTGLPVRGRRYALEQEDGSRVEGVTDEHGLTQLVAGQAMGELKVTVFPEQGAV